MEDNCVGRRRGSFTLTAQINFKQSLENKTCVRKKASGWLDQTTQSGPRKVGGCSGWTEDPRVPPDACRHRDGAGGRDGKDELVGFFRFAVLTETAVSHANRGSFDNGVVHQGRDEGDVLAGQAIDKPAVIEAAQEILSS